MAAIKAVLRDYSALKAMARKLYDKDKIDECLLTISTAARLAYRFNFRFCDPVLDELLVRVAKEKTRKIPAIEPRPGTYAFFDTFALDQRGLTQQYIQALITWGVEFLFIFDYGTTEAHAKEILKTLQDYPKATIAWLKGGANAEERINERKRVIREYCPEKAFLHLAPWSVEAIAAWSDIAGVERFLINITDHAYWLGSVSMDYCIEFREFGCRLSMTERKISRDRLLLQPYYPIVKGKVDFLGFPVSTIGKTVLLSGGAYYKVFGENDVFFKSIKRVFEENSGIILFFAGDGDRVQFRKKLREYDLVGKVIPIGDRRDIEAVVRHSDIYVGTYPVSGGLMCLLACACDVPSVSLFSTKYAFADSESVFPKLKAKGTINCTKHENFFSEINALIQDREYRAKKAKLLSDSMFTESEFSQSLKITIDEKRAENFSNSADLHLDALLDLYLDVENNSIATYKKILDVVFSIADPLAFFFCLVHNRKIIALGWLRSIKRKLLWAGRKIFS
jgi:hypothetical protein